MKHVTGAFLIAVVCAISPVWSQAGSRANSDTTVPIPPIGYYLGTMIDTVGDKKVGDLTQADLQAIYDAARLKAMGDYYVEKMGRASLFFPGAGQFMTGNVGAGFGFMFGHLTVISGTLVGAYFLLPADVQFNNLDYLNDSRYTIFMRWVDHSFMDFLPSMGVFIGGMAVDGILMYFSSKNAAQSARKNVNEGKVNLEAEVGAGFWKVKLSY